MESSGARLPGDGLLHKLRGYGRLVMFQHTLFSLSFAAVSMTLAAGGLPPLRTVFWILVAFLGARTGANALNRAVDAELDALNPRTATRQIPRGLIRKPEAVALALGCFAVMAAAALMLNPLCLLLSPGALLLMVSYSYTKRFTWLCHLALGVTSACAPVGAWVAVTGRLDVLPLALGAANALWVAGFDIVYATLDYDFDRSHGLRSIPARFGVARALDISAAFHAATVLLLAAAGRMSPRLGALYGAGVLAVAALFATGRLSVSAQDLSRVKFASYGINMAVSAVYMIAGVTDALR